METSGIRATLRASRPEKSRRSTNSEIERGICLYTEVRGSTHGARSLPSAPHGRLANCRQLIANSARKRAKRPKRPTPGSLLSPRQTRAIRMPTRAQSQRGRQFSSATLKTAHQASAADIAAAIQAESRNCSERLQRLAALFRHLSDQLCASPVALPNLWKTKRKHSII